MRTKIYFNLIHHNVFSFIKSNITDIVNKLSVSFFFIITKVVNKNLGVPVVQDRIIT